MQNFNKKGKDESTPARSVDPTDRAGEMKGGGEILYHESIDWELRDNNPVRKSLQLAERISLFFERPVRWIVRSPEFNPLYHTGTITVFLLLVILFTGVYLTMFYQFGFSASYEAVANIEANIVGRFM